jgi:hypothetical protein
MYSDVKSVGFVTETINPEHATSQLTLADGRALAESPGLNVASCTANTGSPVTESA